MTKEEYLFTLKETLKVIAISEAEIKETEIKIWDNSVSNKQEIIKINSAAKAAFAEAKEDLWRLFHKVEHGECIIDIESISDEDDEFFFRTFVKYEKEYFEYCEKNNG